MLDAEDITGCLIRSGYHAELSDGRRLRVRFEIRDREVALVHEFPNELLRVPRFDLEPGHGFGKLGHVLTDGRDDGGEVCIGDVASTSVNIDCPESVYLETVEKHVRLLSRLIESPACNRGEQLREFRAHWRILCRRAEGGTHEIFVAWEGVDSDRLQVRAPQVETGKDLETRHVAIARALANAGGVAPLRECANWAKRPSVGSSIGIRLAELTPAPATPADVLPWYFATVSYADASGKLELGRLHRKRSREYWLVFSAPVTDGDAVFALHWRHGTKVALPSSLAEAQERDWTLTPHVVRLVSRGALVPRGGGTLDLAGKSVLLVGCGAVGSEVAHRITSAGVGRLTVCDPDRLSEENLYRHTLSLKDVGAWKSEAVAAELALKHPWAEVTAWRRCLEEVRDLGELREFDLVIVAIASTTVERTFAEYCREAQVGVPTINCWLEGYGIGGHAILAVPGSKGCWHCAYVDPKTLGRGLVSNLNFLVPGQVTMRDRGACGDQYLPFSGIAASQTATMTADLAVRWLLGEVEGSTRVSWRGSATEAEGLSLETTYRYRHFERSLMLRPLHDENCDLCSD